MNGGILSRPSMKIAAVYCVYNEADYIEYSIRSVAPSVERVIINLGMAPWNAYNANARADFGARDRTEDIVDRLARDNPKIVVIKGIWDSEVAQREAGMSSCVESGCDYYFLVDGDEVYRGDHLQAIRDEIERHPEVGTFQIKCTVLWRSFKYRIPYWGVQWTPWRIFKITRQRPFAGLRLPYRCRVTGPNRTNSLGPRYLIPPERAIFYHLGYARTNVRMQLKLGTSEGRTGFLSHWYDRVWLRWPSDRSMLNLSPVDPPSLPQAVYVEPADLQEVLRDHPYWNWEIIQ